MRAPANLERPQGFPRRALEGATITNLAMAGRDWLIAIDQIPDYSIIIDRFGKKVGRYTDPAEDEAWG
ncbi:hypothetical protein V5E97_17360 [Singulisphaera sp. Ch08]|uniref:Uncharacterized protein n=1 Tax=Singulisphaera sp. Ch08 TaxID=3120278 RepID=A0AAU7CRZ8_9BACT